MSAVADPSLRVNQALRTRIAELEAKLASLQPAGPDSSIHVSDAAWESIREGVDTTDFPAMLSDAERAASFGTWTWNVNTNEVWWSEGLYRILGLDPATTPATTENFYGAVHPDDLDWLREESTRNSISGQTPTSEVRIRRPDGNVRWVLMSGASILDEQGQLRRIVGTVSDITEAVHRRSELAQVNHVLRQVQQMAGLGTWHVRLPATTIRLSDDARSILELEAGSDLDLADLHRFMQPEERERFRRLIERPQPDALDEVQGKWALVTARGRPRTVKIGAEYELDDAGQRVGIIGTVLDVSDIETAERSLRNQLELLAVSERLARMGSFACDRNGRELQVSEEMARRYRLPTEGPVTLEDFVQAVHPKDRERVRKFIDATLERDREGFVEYRIVRPDGSIGHEQAMFAPQHHAKGWIDRGYWVCRDVSNRVESDRKRALLAAVTQLTEDSVVITDADGVIEYVNPAFVRHTGYSEDDVLGRKPSILRSGQTPEETYEHLWQTITQGHSWQGRLVNRKKDGTLFEEDAYIYPIRDGDAEITNFVAVKHNITLKRQLQERLEMVDRLVAVGTLASGIAHDFNNLLTPIVGFTQMALRQMEADGPARESLEIVLSTAERARSLVSRILGMSRHKAEPVGTVAFDQVVREAVELIRETIPASCALSTRIDAQDGLVQADAAELQSVCANLCVNAAQAIQEKGAPGGEILLTLRRKRCNPRGECGANLPVGEYVTLEVSDNGIGMDQVTLKRAFEPFFTTKAAGFGTGLGLPQAVGVAQSRGGHMYAESVKGQGTRVVFCLPLARPAGDAPASTKPAPAAVPASAHGEVILVVEDEPNILQMLQMVLERAGYVVHTATNGEAALRVLRSLERPPHLVLSDNEMPTLSGAQLARTISKEFRDTPIVIMSGRPLTDDEQRALPDAVIGTLRKPFNINELQVQIEELMLRRPHPSFGHA